MLQYRHGSAPCGKATPALLCLRKLASTQAAIAGLDISENIAAFHYVPVTFALFMHEKVGMLH